MSNSNREELQAFSKIVKATQGADLFAVSGAATDAAQVAGIHRFHD